ncbi:Protein unc-80 [Nymphon striatum]|nr:Protein unc-80 [Nymphon striatum]
MAVPNSLTGYWLQTKQRYTSEWPRIARCIKELGNNNRGSLALWNFLDFVVTHRTPLFVLLQPFIQYKLLPMICDNEQEYYYQQLISDKIQGFNLPTPKSKGLLLADLSKEMSTLKDRLTNKRAGDYNLLQPPSVNRSPQPFTMTRFGMGGSITTSIRKASVDDEESDHQISSDNLVNRGWSVRSESRLPWQTQQSVKVKSVGKKDSVLFRRTSYHGGDKTSQESKLYRKSTLFVRKRSNKQVCNDSTQSIPMSDAGDCMGMLSGETTPTGSADPLATSGDFFQKSRHRLQRQKAQSRKTFRSKKSRKGRIDSDKIMAEETELMPRKQPSTLAEESFDMGSSSPGLVIREASRAIKIPESIAINTQDDKEPWKTVLRTSQRRGAVHAHSRSPSPVQSPECEPHLNESAESLSSGEKSLLLKNDNISVNNSQSHPILFYKHCSIVNQEVYAGYGIFISDVAPDIIDGACAGGSKVVMYKIDLAQSSDLKIIEPLSFQMVLKSKSEDEERVRSEE